MGQIHPRCHSIELNGGDGRGESGARCWKLHITSLLSLTKAFPLQDRVSITKSISKALT